MGINKESLDFIIDTIDNYGIELMNCRMVELGNQMLKGIGGAAKLYFQSLGVDHVSIDMNGKNGALNLDLQLEIKDFNLLETFNVLTNFGTTEHVRHQSICWLNVHNLVKQNGIFIHLVPRTEHWKSHGYHKYSLEFFENLVYSCGYKVLENFIRKADSGKDLICCVLVKKENDKFISSKVFNTLGISRR